MGNEVTFSMLERMAAANGRTDVEAFAKEQGFTDEQIQAAKNADKEFRDGAFGGEMPAPGEVTEFSYKKVNINGIEGVLSFYAKNATDGNIKLSQEARKQLKEYGIENLVMQDGVLHVQHKDGNMYPFYGAEDFTPDFAAVEEEKKRKENESMTKGIVNGLKDMGKALLSLTPLGLQSCSEKTDISIAGDQTVKEQITMYKNEMSDEEKQYWKQQLELLQSINSHVTSIDEKLSQQYNEIYSALMAILDSNSVSYSQIESLLTQLSDLVKVVITNQEQSSEDNRTRLDTIINLINIIIEKSEIDADLKKQLLEILKGIKEDTSKIDSILDKLEKLIGLNKTQCEKLETITNQNEELKAILEAIYAKLDDMDADMQNYFKGIVTAIVANGAKLDDLTKLLKVINNNVVNGNAQQKEAAKKILAALQELNFTVVGGMDAILQAVLDGNVKLDEILAVLDKIKNLIKEYGNKGTALGNAILEAISKVNVNLVNGFNGIAELIERVIQNQNLTNTQIAKLTALFEQFSGDTTVTLEKILEAIGNDSAKLDDIIQLLIQMDANNETRNKKVLDAIAKLGNDVTADLTAILKAINNISPSSTQNDYREILNAILDKIKEGNDQNDANFKAVLAKIKELGVNVAYGMNAILEAFQNQPDYTSRLDAIIAKLNALGDKAQEILVAIKDHNVQITVDVTGKVKCECNCNCGNGGTHEGIIGDLQNLLG